MQNIDSDLIRGNIDTIILKTMLNEDKYGLDIIKEVSDKSSGTYELKQPTLYSCLKRLENQELISSYWVDSDIGGKRHYYKLTEKGRDFYNKKQEEWAKSKFIIDNLLSNYNHEEYRLVKKDEYDQIIQDKANAPISEFSNTLTDDDYGTDTDSEETEDAEEDKTDLNETEDEETAAEAKDETDEESTTEDDAQEDFDEEDKTEEFDLNQDDEEDADSEDTEDEDETIDQDEEDDENYPVYFNTSNSYEYNADSEEESDEDDDEDSEEYNQSENELNILSRLREQDDEEINTYVGDKQSYINHVNIANDDSKLEQQDLLDDSLYTYKNNVDNSIDSFEDAVEKLNNFSSEGTTDEETEETQEPEEIESPVEEKTTFEEDDDLNELSTLKSNSSNGFFKSYDSADYGEVSQNNYDETDSSDAALENEYNFSDISSEIQPVQEIRETSVQEEQPAETDQFSEIDSIITNNITSFNETKPTFNPQQAGSYREKLSNLSMYSRVTLDEETKPEVKNDEAIEKAKDMAEITKELEAEGIKVKEHYKFTKTKNVEKNYLLTNKLNLIRTLILFFGYVFLLSAVYIVLNNTSMSNNSWFSIKYFLFGFIPFAIILTYYLIVFLLHPYQKVVSKYHARIMLFIAIIVTIQLLLITYCVNLQLGFYSFKQQAYNHLLWIVPLIISFAPIFDYIIYYALYKSKKFHV